MARRKSRGTKGMKCVRKKRTRAGLRCAKFAKRGKR